MIMTLELSMYPLREDYKTPIQHFIDKLNADWSDLRITTTATSTMVCGEYDRLMQMMSVMLRWSYDTHGKAVYVAKFIPDYDPA